MSGVGRSAEIEESSRIGEVVIGKIGSTIVEIVEADMIDMVRVVEGAAEVVVEVEVGLVGELSMMTMILAAARSSSKDEA